MRGRRRAARLVAIAVAGALAVVGVFVLPDYVRAFAPATLLQRPVEWLLLALAVGYVVARTRPRLRERIARLDELAGRELARWLPRALGAAVVVALATWLPHYLTWPMSRDHDTFATLAQGWDAGRRPYRDVKAYNFPGQIYLCWALGKTVGWGRPRAFFAADAALVVALVATLRAWSRRRFGTTLPGWIGGLLALVHYLNLGHFAVAERDWQGPLILVLGLLACEGWPGRASRLVAAATTAVALAFRPHVLLFLPAVVAAIDEGARPSGGSWKMTARALGEWSLAFAIAVLVAFAPVMIAGAFGDLIRAARGAAFGGSYGRNSPAVIVERIWRQVEPWKTAAPIVAAAGMSIAGPRTVRRTARTWALALAAAVVYKPIHPVQHAYLGHPLALISAVVVAVLVAWIVAATRHWPTLGLLAVLVILKVGIPSVPTYCSVNETIRAFPALIRGDESEAAPAGADPWFVRRGQTIPASDYDWGEYRAVLRYLRAETTPTTRVANLLRRFPFPAINGPAGRLDVFPVESGVVWLFLGPDDPGLGGRLAAALEQATDSVVVWEPDGHGADPRLRVDAILGVVRRDYEPAARFGRIEVWRRKRRVRVS
ncbi:MAG TPA: hypothetical protein VG406_28875 [Isosphaeraceae bacterium]|jgi:hypothetical protein|nr:hypothetical protein [Isosphaeraceae bacterium]